jgi:hypothetical protein
MQLAGFMRALGFFLMLGFGCSVVGCGAGARDPSAESSGAKPSIREDYQQKKAALQKAAAAKGGPGRSRKSRSNSPP